MKRTFHSLASSASLLLLGKKPTTTKREEFRLFPTLTETITPRILQYLPLVDMMQLDRVHPRLQQDPGVRKYWERMCALHYIDRKSGEPLPVIRRLYTFAAQNPVPPQFWRQNYIWLAQWIHLVCGLATPTRHTRVLDFVVEQAMTKYTPTRPEGWVALPSSSSSSATLRVNSASPLRVFAREFPVPLSGFNISLVCRVQYQQMPVAQVLAAQLVRAVGHCTPTLLEFGGGDLTYSDLERMRGNPRAFPFPGDSLQDVLFTLYNPRAFELPLVGSTAPLLVSGHVPAIVLERILEALGPGSTTGGRSLFHLPLTLQSNSAFTVCTLGCRMWRVDDIVHRDFFLDSVNLDVAGRVLLQTLSTGTLMDPSILLHSRSDRTFHTNARQLEEMIPESAYKQQMLASAAVWTEEGYDEGPLGTLERYVGVRTPGCKHELLWPLLLIRLSRWFLQTTVETAQAPLCHVLEGETITTYQGRPPLVKENHVGTPFLLRALMESHPTSVSSRRGLSLLI